jgi:dienelactone hydrolase
LDASVQQSVQWLERSALSVEVTENVFLVKRATGNVPGLLWLPLNAKPWPPLVLLGHGGSGHKRSDRIVGLAHWFAAQAGMAALAIDGPYHGSRLSTSLATGQYQDLIAAEGPELVINRMVADWLAAIDAVTALGSVDTARLGYIGLSMATRYGLPTAATLADRLKCAVFGKFGLQQTSQLSAGIDTASRIRADAPRITAPTLFHLQWDDDRFTRNGQLELFDLLGSTDKRLIAYAGGHNETHPAAVSTWQAFIYEHLADRAPETTTPE